MEGIQQEVIDQLTAAGGSMVYKPLYEAVSFKSQRQLYPALREMKRKGRVTLVNHIDKKTKRAVFTISLVGDGGD